MNIWQFSENNIEILETLNTLPEGSFVWIDAGTNEVLTTVKIVENILGKSIHERHVKDCLNLQHPSFYESTQHYDIMIVRSVASNHSYNCIETMPVSFLIFNNTLVTFHTDDNAVHRVKTRLNSTRKRMPSSPMSLTFLLLDEIVDNFLELRIPLLDKFNYWQQELFVDSKQPLNWLDFLNFKKDIRKLRVMSEDQLEVVYQWRQDNELSLSEHSTIRFNDLSDHIQRIITYATQLENDLDTLIELHYLLIGNKTNEVMRILTVLSAIFLPLNLVAGIFGMNFSNMHLLQVKNGENIALLGMVSLGTILFAIFKLKKWI